ncbi:MAG: peptidoglycan-binding protein [Candidatus Sericytochromatia bacterium]
MTELPRQDQTRLTPQGKAAGSIGLADPSIDEIRGGHVMVQGAKGPAVKKLQQLLTKAGYPVQVNGSFGPTTEGILKRFQQDHGIEVNGKLGPTTLKKLENPMAETAFGRLLARTGYSKAMSLGGYSSLSKCYTGVGTALEQTGVRMTGLSAYLAADQLARSPRFREVKISANQLPKLPAGAVVVWDRSASPAQRLWGGGWTHGHISIADGKGREMSDYIDAQRTTYYASNRFRVFLPK